MTAAKKKKTKKNKIKPKVSWNIAKSQDGTIQITYTIPSDIIEENRNKAALELGKGIDVPGFRKGKAPLNKLIEHIPDNTLLENTLARILPDTLSKTIQEEKLQLAIYPRFELIKANEDEDWQVRATTAQMPEVELGDYKKLIQGEARSKAIWTPDKSKDEPEKKEEITQAEKEQEVINILLDKIEVNIPQMLIDEEVNARVARLIEKIDKMGLDLEAYLKSIGKTAEILRQEYSQQAREALSLDLILTKIAQEEEIKISKEDIDKAISLSGGEEAANDQEDSQRRSMIENILRRREALSKLVAFLG